MKSWIPWTVASVAGGALVISNVAWALLVYMLRNGQDDLNYILDEQLVTIGQFERLVPRLATRVPRDEVVRAGLAAADPKQKVEPWEKEGMVDVGHLQLHFSPDGTLDRVVGFVPERYGP